MAWVSTNDLVQRQIDTFKDYASRAYDQALAALQQISTDFDAGWKETGVGWGGVPGTGGGASLAFNRPDPPADPEIEYEPPIRPTGEVTGAEIGDAIEAAQSRFSSLTMPVFTATPLPLTLPSAPTTTLPALPADPAPPVMPEYPTVPSYDTPLVPEMRHIVLPTLVAPDLAAIAALLAELRAQRPVAPELPEFSDLSGLVAEQYAVCDARLLDFVASCPALASMRSRLAELLAGGSTGIPAPVATAMRERAFGVQDRLSVQAEHEALRDWLGRGFTLPDGALEARMETIRQEARDKKAQINRDVWIEEAKQEIENLRFAVQQGIAYEGELRQSWAALHGIVNDIAKAEIDTEVKILEAALALFDAKVKDRAAEFGTIRDQLQAELAHLDIYRGELEGQKLVGELNQQDVDLYKTRWEAATTAIGLYKTEVDAANARLQGEKTKLEYAADLVQRHLAVVQSYSEEWKAHGIAADAEKTKSGIYKDQADAFASRVTAYVQSVSAAKSRSDIDIDGIKLKLESWRSKVEQYKADLQAEVSRVESAVKAAGLLVERYRAIGGVESSAMGFEIQKLDYELNVNKLTADTAIKEAELAQTRELALQKVALDSLDGIARTGAQLAGSAMSAMNVSASLGSSSSTSDNFTEYHYYNETG